MLQFNVEIYARSLRILDTVLLPRNNRLNKQEQERNLIRVYLN